MLLQGAKIARIASHLQSSAALAEIALTVKKLSAMHLSMSLVVNPNTRASHIQRGRGQGGDMNKAGQVELVGVAVVPDPEPEEHP